jgi:histidinol-phosphate aminotransferase
MTEPLFSSLSRRGFLAAAAASAALPFIKDPERAAAEQSEKKMEAVEEKKILLNANENPLGPCDAALAAITALGARSGRYDLPAAIELANLIMEQEGLKEGYLALYPGASDPLQFSVLAYTQGGRSLITSDPTYETPTLVAAAAKIPTSTVALRNGLWHDVQKMAAVDSNAGCIYLCNPNNPTGTVTTRDDIYWLLTHKPRNAVVVVDESYIHFSDAKTVIDFALDNRDIVVLRSFSCFYGLAGLRIGFAVGRPDLLERLQVYGLNPLPLPGVVAARASLLDKQLVKTRKALNTRIRNATMDWLHQQGYEVTPSETNFFMVNVKRPAGEFVKALAHHNVIIGRTWSSLPQHIRVSVGTADEMRVFQSAFAEVAGHKG